MTTSRFLTYREVCQWLEDHQDELRDDELSLRLLANLFNASSLPGFGIEGTVRNIASVVEFDHPDLDQAFGCTTKILEAFIKEPEDILLSDPDSIPR